MRPGLRATAGVTPEVRAALDQILVRRSRLLMVVAIALAAIFVIATHTIGSARSWSDLMNIGAAAAMGVGLIVTRGRAGERHIVVICVIFGILLGVVRALAGFWHGDVASTALFMVVLAMMTAAMLPWGLWAQLAMVCPLAVALGVNAVAVAGGIGQEAGRAAANVALGLAGSLILAAETRRYHIRLLIDQSSRRDAELALEKLNAELEQRIAARTAELARVQQAALQHQADLAHVLRLGTMGEMTAGLAHEINQPLGAIANYAQGSARRLRDGAIDAQALLPIVEEIGAEALRAGEIIRRLRDLVRKDSGRQVQVDLNHIVRESVRVIEPEARARNVALRLQLAPTLPVVTCNDIQIEQVLLNLLLNGVEAVEAAANGQRTISIRTALTDEGAEVAVRDSGIGLPPPPADVFAQFYTTKADGLGMGLSISRSIVEAHGGQLWGTGNPDCGATFRFTLPL